jgi:hypothetical protein
MGVTREQLIRHGQAIERLQNDETVQTLFDTLDEIYFKNWKDAKDPAEREAIHAEASAFGALKKIFEKTVAVGQHEAHLLEQQELADAQARNQH